MSNDITEETQAVESLDRAALRAKVKKGFRLFTVISTVTVLGIFLYTMDAKMWTHLSSLRPLYLAGILLLWALYLFFDGLRVRILASALGGKVDLRTAAEVILTGLFLAAVTPFQIGGFPVQLYILKKRSLSLGKSTLVVLFRGVLTTVLLAPIFPFIYVFYRQYFTSAVIRGLFFYLAIVFPVGLAVFLVFMLFPRKIRRLLRFLRRYRLIAPLFDRFFREVDDAKRGLVLYFFQKRLQLFYAFLATIASTICFYLIALTIILGLGISAPKLDVVIRQLILNVILMFIPTPGASGVAELGFTALFSPVCPRELLAVYMLLWRFFTFYLGVMIGGIMVLKLLKPPKKQQSVVGSQ